MSRQDVTVHHLEQRGRAEQPSLISVLAAMQASLETCIAALRAGDVEQLPHAVQAIDDARVGIEHAALVDSLGSQEQATLVTIRALAQRAQALVQLLLSINTQALTACQARLAAQANYHTFRPRYGVDRSA